MGITTLVSGPSTGGPESSALPAISADGRFVAFVADGRFSPLDQDFFTDIYVRDLTEGTTELVSVNDQGIKSTGESASVTESGDSRYGPAISSDGRFVAFHAGGSNLVENDTNGWYDVFVRDRQTNTTQLVSVSSRERQGQGVSEAPVMSEDARFIAFSSLAPDLAPGDTNDAYDVYLRDTHRGTTQRVSLGTGGRQANQDSYVEGISANGRFVVFVSSASNLVAGDRNGVADVFVRDVVLRRTSRVSVGPDGEEALGASISASISGDGSLVVFGSYADNLVPGDSNGDQDVFVRDVRAGTTDLVSVAQTSGPAYYVTSADPVISTDGRHVAFTSISPYLVPGDTNGTDDIFIRDLAGLRTSRVSVGDSGQEAQGHSFAASITQDGRGIAFASGADNLVPQDPFANLDVFVHLRQ